MTEPRRLDPTLATDWSSLDDEPITDEEWDIIEALSGPQEGRPPRKTVVVDDDDDTEDVGTGETAKEREARIVSEYGQEWYDKHGEESLKAALYVFGEGTEA